MFNFQPLTAENISQILNWFSDTDTIKYLGDQNWIKNALERPALAKGKFFRGATVLERQGYIAYQNDLPIGYLEAETYDKYTVCTGYDESKKPIIESTEDKKSCTFIYTVDPKQRGHGYATEIIKAFIDFAKLKGVSIFVATTDPGNDPSEKSLEKAGFRKLSEKLNFEDVYIWIYRV